MSIRYTLWGENDGTIPAALIQLCNLGDRGKLGTTLHRVEGRSSSWDRLCALEEDMLKASHPDNDETTGWYLAVGESWKLDGVIGWLEHGDWIFVFATPEYQDEHETDVLVVPRDDWESTFMPETKACVALGDDSGMRLNRALREVAELEAAYAGGTL